MAHHAPQRIDVHPTNPQIRLIQQATALLRAGDIIAVPTDSSYALVAHLDDKDAADRMRKLRGIDNKQHLAVLCRDLSELATYAKVDNAQYRMLKLGTPGPFTFILEATKEVPRRLSHPQRKTVGLRVPEGKVIQMLLEDHGAPLLATTLIPPDSDEPLNDVDDIAEAFPHGLAAIIDAGACPAQPTTVIDMSQGGAEILRIGRGDPSRLGL